MSDACRVCHQPHAPNTPHLWPDAVQSSLAAWRADKVEERKQSDLEQIAIIDRASGGSDTFDPHCPCCVEAKRQRDEKMAKARAARGKRNA